MKIYKEIKIYVFNFLSVKTFSGSLIIVILGVFLGLFFESIYSNMKEQTLNNRIFELMLSEVQSNRISFKENQNIYEKAYKEIQEVVNYSDSMYYYNSNNKEVFEGIISKSQIITSLNQTTGFKYNTEVHNIILEGGLSYTHYDIDLVMEINNYYNFITFTESQLNKIKESMDFSYNPRYRKDELDSIPNSDIKLLIEYFNKLRIDIKKLRMLNASVEDYQNKKLRYFLNKIFDYDELNKKEKRELMKNFKV